MIIIISPRTKLSVCNKIYEQKVSSKWKMEKRQKKDEMMKMKEKKYYFSFHIFFLVLHNNKKHGEINFYEYTRPKKPLHIFFLDSMLVFLLSRVHFLQ